MERSGRVYIRIRRNAILDHSCFIGPGPGGIPNASDSRRGARIHLPPSAKTERIHAGRVRGRRIDTTFGEDAMKKSGIARLAFAGATAVALAFGATQALAAPVAPESTDVRACTDRYCREVACYPFYGYCDRRLGICACAG